MKKIKYIIGLALLITTCVHAQDNQDKVCVKEFYRVLFSNKKVSISEFSKVYSNADPGYEVGLLGDFQNLSHCYSSNYLYICNIKH